MQMNCCKQNLQGMVRLPTTTVYSTTVEQLKIFKKKLLFLAIVAYYCREHYEYVLNLKHSELHCLAKSG